MTKTIGESSSQAQAILILDTKRFRCAGLLALLAPWAKEVGVHLVPHLEHEKENIRSCLSATHKAEDEDHGDAHSYETTFPNTQASCEMNAMSSIGSVAIRDRPQDGRQKEQHEERQNQREDQRQDCTHGRMPDDLVVPNRDHGGLDLHSAETAKSLLHQLEGWNVRLIIVNVGGEMPSCEQMLRPVKDTFPDIPIAIISDHEDSEEAAQAFAAKAQAFVPTSLDASLVLLALGFVMDGGTFFPPNLLNGQRSGSGRRLGSQVTCAAEVGTLNGARPTPRQQEVLELLCEGKSNKMIARELDMQESTVKVHVRQIMRKLNASNRTQAALLAMQMKPAEQTDRPHEPSTGEPERLHAGAASHETHVLSDRYAPLKIAARS